MKTSGLTMTKTGLTRTKAQAEGRRVTSSVTKETKTATRALVARRTATRSTPSS
jgi:hypothetical protein